MKICVVIGSPVSHSLSPVMHNAAFEACGISTQYSFAAELVTPADLEMVLEKARRKFHFIAVTIPHKEAILKYLNKLDKTAQKIGAVNTVLNAAGELTGFNTDSPGAIAALNQHTVLKGKKVAILGSGGTARAILYGLVQENSAITVFGRNKSTAKKLAREFGCNASEWEDKDKAVESDIIINTTPIGRNGEPSPIPAEGITSNHIVFDVNYFGSGTAMFNESKKKGAGVIDGLELLIQQGILQFELYTGLKAPEEAMRKAVYEHGTTNRGIVKN